MDTLKHIAIIPDGNRRWAREKGKHSFQGHKAAVNDTLPKLIETMIELRIPYFTFWALSTENFQSRTKEEMNNLLHLIRLFLKTKLKEFKKKNIRLKVIGDISILPQDIQDGIREATVETADNTVLTFILALNYGGKDEILRTVKRIQNSEFRIQNLNKENFSTYLDTAGIPDPDIIIRTGGEQRLSGFMLWQSEYSELFFPKLFFPEFTPGELKNIIEEFYKRERRFGK